MHFFKPVARRAVRPIVRSNQLKYGARPSSPSESYRVPKKNHKETWDPLLNTTVAEWKVCKPRSCIFLVPLLADPSFPPPQIRSRASLMDPPTIIFFQSGSFDADKETGTLSTPVAVVVCRPSGAAESLFSVILRRPYSLVRVSAGEM
ncbi:hypothetical protein Zmor_009608 [Zophobas morio]|uniref:Uncharacterized protein n=1 Tax=Zophobas morio TaxID=2755281 RepID=A0AA38IMN6_9CUCU|nr:hypothetical protein Zmor_009608 [Zophobas morio]